jgi:hypothetical protein
MSRLTESSLSRNPLKFTRASFLSYWQEFLSKRQVILSLAIGARGGCVRYLIGTNKCDSTECYDRNEYEIDDERCFYSFLHMCFSYTLYYTFLPPTVPRLSLVPFSPDLYIGDCILRYEYE